MRTTITIDVRLLDQVRQRAAELRQTVSQVIEDSVRDSLLRRGGDAAADARYPGLRWRHPLDSTPAA